MVEGPNVAFNRHWAHHGSITSLLPLDFFGLCSLARSNAGAKVVVEARVHCIGLVPPS